MSRTVFIFLLATVLPLSAQEWGRVSGDMLQKKHFEQAPEAPAIILFEKGNMRILPNFELEISFHSRIKILNQAGKEYSKAQVSLWGSTVLQELEAHTISPNGHMRKVNQNEVFKFKNGRTRYLRFTFPAIEPGCILEYRYRVTNPYLIDLEPWFFQNELYTLKSEVSVHMPPGFEYNTFFANLRGKRIRPQKQMYTDMYFDTGEISQFTWAMNNIAALREEPFTFGIDDHRTALSFQMISYHGQRQKFEFIKTWDDLAEEAGDFYKKFLSDKKGVKDLMKELVPEKMPSRKNAEILYNYVSDLKTTAKTLHVFSDQLKRPRDVLKNRSGTYVEKNLLLINLLQKAGFSAWPMLVKTRDRGIFKDDWPLLQEFNHLLAVAEVDDKLHILDAANGSLPYGLLPPRDLVSKGLLIKKKQGKLLKLTSPRRISALRISGDAKLAASGELQCDAQIRFEIYRSYNARKAISNEGLHTYARNLLSESFSQVEIDTIRATNLKNKKKDLIIDVAFKVPGFAQLTGDKMYVPLPLIDKIAANPFTSKERTYPVEFDFPFSSFQEIKIIFPDGFAVEELPRKAGQARMEYAFSSKVINDSTHASLQRSFEIKTPLIKSGLYKNLKNFYGKAVSADQAQIVLSKR